MIRLVTACERRNVVYFSLWEDVGYTKENLQFNKWLINGKMLSSSNGSFNMCVNYVAAQDDPCDLARWVWRSSMASRSLAHMSSNFKWSWKLPAEPLHLLVYCVPMAQVSWHFLTQMSNSPFTENFLFC